MKHRGGSMNRIARSLVALLGLPILGCAGEPSAQPGAAPEFLPLPAPTLVIGREDSPDYQFVGITAAHRLSNGDIAITDRLPAVRIYDAAGRLARTLGRRGAGPGEFRYVRNLFLTGDTLIVFDGLLRRLTRYHASGTLLGTQLVRTPAEDLGVTIVGRLAGGRWAVETPNTPRWERGPGIYRDTVRVGTIAPSSTGPVTWAGTFPSLTYFVHMPGEDQSRWVSGVARFAPYSVTGTFGDTVVFGDTETAELRFFAADGRQVRRLALPLDPAPDLARHRAAARDAELALERPGSDSAYTLAAYDAPRPTPLYRDFLIASDGQLWVRLFEADPDGPSRYLVLAPTGAVQARVSLPPGGRVVNVQSPWVLAVMRNADDVETIGVIRWAAP